MYNIKLNDYVPAPSPAHSDRIVAAHYYAAWKYGAAGLHEGFNDLAKDYPERTPLMGYYDEENPEVSDWEIKWAVEHGINCFIYCWYRKPENVGKTVTVESLRCPHGIHEALLRARYRKHMKFALMFEVSPRWGATDSQDIVENLMPFWMENYFALENYLVIDNKPVLFVYNPERLATEECFGDGAGQRSAFDACREYAKSRGFDGMIFAACEYDGTKHSQYVDNGFDFRFGYGSGYMSEEDFSATDDEIIAGQCDIYRKQLENDPLRFVPTASCFSDPTPRFTERWNALGYRFREWCKIWYLSPEGYRRVLEEMKEISDALPDGAWGKRMIMIDNWNEWDEGHYVAPSHEFGFKYLQAIREALTARDNLPDYRTPQDQGFTGYNTSWVTPDFSAVCAERLKKK